MSHPVDGMLRRLLDEPEAIDDATRRHVDGCTNCQARSAALASEAGAAHHALAGADAPVDAGAALGVVFARRMAFAGHPAGAAWRFPSRRLAPYGAIAAVVAVLFLATFAPMRSIGQSFLAIFEPRQFVAIPVTQADLQSLRALPDLDAYGVVREIARPVEATVADSRSAALIAGAPVRVPAWLPAGIPATVQYHVMGRTSATFTFSAARAAATEAASGKPLPPMSPSLDGSTLIASIGPVVIASYGAYPAHRMLMHAHKRGRLAFNGPFLLVAQAPAPRISSTGASVREIESYLLHLPGVPPQLAAQIAAIGDPATTLPIPIPIERELAQPVTVQGGPGLGVLDNTGIGSGVLWQRGRSIYAVVGTLPAREIMTVANSLK